jgi:hypothetical protein
MAREYDRWTPEEINEVRRLREEVGLTWPEIGEKLGRLPARCKAKWGNVRCRLRLTKSRERIAELQPDEVVMSSVGVRKEPPPEALAEREARIDAANLQSLGGTLMGDPPPGFSALEREPVQRKRKASRITLARWAGQWQEEENDRTA